MNLVSRLRVKEEARRQDKTKVTNSNGEANKMHYIASWENILKYQNTKYNAHLTPRGKKI